MRKRKFSFKKLDVRHRGVSCVAIFLLVLLLSPIAADAALMYKSVDVMKWTKDRITNQQSDAEIESVVNAIMDIVKPQYISISVPMDSNSDVAQYSTLGPRTIEQFTQVWVNTIRAYGGRVLWRGTWSGIEGIYNFPKRVGAARYPAGTAASAPTDGSSTWLGKTYRYIIDHPTFFADGDIWAPIPERTENIFSDTTSFLPHDAPGIQEHYADFFNNVKAISDTAFAAIGKNVTTGLTANNFTEVNSGWMYQSVIDTAGLVVVDHYGLTHTPEEMSADLRKVSSERGKMVFLQEWGDYWNVGQPLAERLAYLVDMFAVFQKLIDDNVLAGFNYWGAWNNDLEGILNSQGGSFTVNERGVALANFFAGQPITLPSPPSSTTPTSTSTPPASSPQATSTPQTPPSSEPASQPQPSQAPSQPATPPPASAQNPTENTAVPIESPSTSGSQGAAGQQQVPASSTAPGSSLAAGATEAPVTPQGGIVSVSPPTSLFPSVPPAAGSATSAQAPAPVIPQPHDDGNSTLPDEQRVYALGIVQIATNPMSLTIGSWNVPTSGEILESVAGGWSIIWEEMSLLTAEGVVVLQGGNRSRNAAPLAMINGLFLIAYVFLISRLVPAFRRQFLGTTLSAAPLTRPNNFMARH